MKTRNIVLWIALAASLLVSGAVTAQAFLSPVILADIQANGVNIGYFHRAPTVHKWNVTGIPSAAPSISGTTMTLAMPVQANVSVLTPSTTCTAALRGQLVIVEQPNNGLDGGSNDAGNADGGRKDLTFQCCKGSGGTYSWVAAACQ